MLISLASQVALVVKMVKNPPANAGDVRDLSLIPGSGRCPGGGNGNSLQYSCLWNSTNRGTWWATVHGVAKSLTWLSMHAEQIKQSRRCTQGWCVCVCVCVCVCPRRGELGSPCSLWHRNKKLPKAHSHTKLLTPMAQPFITDLLSLFRQDILKMSWPLPTAPQDTSKHSELEKKCQVLVKWVIPHTSNKAFSAENLLRCLSKSFAIQKAR